MADDDLVNELDRNMDTVFDSLYVLNATMNAVVQSLQPQAAAHVMQRLDEALDDLDSEVNPPARMHQMVMNGWRSMAAQIAGSEARQIQARSACRWRVKRKCSWIGSLQDLLGWVRVPGGHVVVDQAIVMVHGGLLNGQNESGR